VTGSSAAEQRLRDFALLRRVRDRIDREYAQPLDVEALARAVRDPAGTLIRIREQTTAARRRPPRRPTPSQRPMSAPWSLRNSDVLAARAERTRLALADPKDVRECLDHAGDRLGRSGRR